MSVLAVVPDNRRAEREYVLNLVLNHHLGLEYQIRFEDRDSTELRLSGGNIVIADTLLSVPDSLWLDPDSLPRLPLRTWDISSFFKEQEVKTADRTIPFLYGDENKVDGVFSQQGNTIDISLDIFGSVFFLVSRYEEVVSEASDGHGRFPARESLAVKADFISRPLADEYVDLLRACLKRLLPGFSSPHRQFKVFPTHDVDHISYWLTISPSIILRTAGSYTLKHLRPDKALASVSKWIGARIGSLAEDPYNTFNWIMDETERAGLRSAFYFIPRRDATRARATYPLSRAVPAMRDIHRRGHEIGLHTPYDAWINPELMRSDLDRLKGACAAENMEQQTWGGRNHYLHAKFPASFEALASAGLDYDSTLGFAERIGFRCGTCIAFPIFDLTKGRATSLLERPLIAMDMSLISPAYMDLGDDPGKAYDHLKEIKGQCERFSGEFVLLWHNSNLTDPVWREVFINILQ